MRKTLLLLLGVVAALPALARDFTYTYEGQTLTYTVLDEDAKTCMAQKGAPITGALVIPSIAKDGETEYTVTRIYNYGFRNLAELTSVSIPNSVTSIGYGAFSGCSGLKSISCLSELPPALDNDDTFEALYDVAVLNIPEAAAINYLTTSWSLFKDIRLVDSEETLKTVQNGDLNYRLIPSSVTGANNIAVIVPGKYSELTDITIPDRFTDTDVRYYVEAIGYNAFKGCSRLMSVSFNSRNKTRLIGAYAFAESGITEITLPETVESIGEYAFNQCYHLTSVSIPEKIQVINDYTFSRCSALTSVDIPSSVTSIGERAFEFCKALTEIEIPGSVKNIFPSAFQSCTNLSKLTLNEGLETIGMSAFLSTALAEITIPKTVTNIDSYAFRIDVLTEDRPIGRLNIPDLEAWMNIDFEDEFSNPMMYCNSVFLNDIELTELVVPEGIKEIKPYVFEWCRSLKSLVLNDELLSIGQFSFTGCHNLSYMKINKGLQKIGNYAFADCGLIESVTIPGSIIELGKLAFRNVKNVTLEYGPETIKNYDDTFEEVINVICDRELNNLSFFSRTFKSLTIGNNVKEIPAGKFKNLNLNTVKLGSNVTSIGDNAFSSCIALTEVVLPPSVETIGTSAFAGATSLSSVIMGSKVNSIGELAFDRCPVAEIKITAPTPPSAPKNTFSVYSGKLYVQGQDAADAYYDASESECWSWFDDPIVMTEPTSIEMEKKSISGKPGDTFQLTATLKPENVTLPHIFWRSTNPEVATVDENGLVTLHQEISGVMTMAENGDDAGPCKIIAESLYANGPVAEVLVNASSSDIDNIFGDNKDAGEIDYSAPYEVYNLQGMKVGATTAGLIPGIYIIRQGSVVKKIAVR